MEGLLTAVNTTHHCQDTKSLAPVWVSSSTSQTGTEPSVSSPEDALEVLRNEPSYVSLVAVLRFLNKGIAKETNFNIAFPSPIGAQLVQVLATDIASNYWTLLKEDADGDVDGSRTSKSPETSVLQKYLNCLRNIPGINALLLRLRALTLDARSEKKDAKRPDLTANIEITLELLCFILQGQESLQRIWNSAAAAANTPTTRRPLMQEFLIVLGGSRVISWAAEAEDHLQRTHTQARTKASWISNRGEYCLWLTRNVCWWIYHDNLDADTELCSEILARTLRLGHVDDTVKLLIEEYLLGPDAEPAGIRVLYGKLPDLEQRKVVFATLRYLAGRHLNGLGLCNNPGDLSVIAGASGLIRTLVGDEVSHLVAWLSASTGAGLGDGVGIRRAVLAVVSKHKDVVVSVLEDIVGLFGDQLYIRHSPILQQEAHAQVLLLCAGYVHRITPIKLTTMTRSRMWLHAISNRLAASQQRARFLGMVVGEAVSSLVDKGDKGLDFHMDETNSEEGSWYKSLVDISDDVSGVDRLQFRPPACKKESSKPKKIGSGEPPVRLRQPSQGFVIEEVDDGSGTEDEDLVPYAKPDSDDEDSDDDPTLVRRDKPKAPVYIRDLITYFRDTENYDHQKLALTAAATLIRRKANYGTEVKEHAEELASLLVGLQDKFEIDDFHNLRMQAMIAIVIAQPQVMGQWFARTFFDGDYSVSQRASVLGVLGISARELAGFERSELAAAASFPSKTLPERLEKLYIEPSPAQKQLSSLSSLKSLAVNEIEGMTESLTKQLLAPIAATAADAVTGPDALKLSTFTSYLQQQKAGQGARGKGPLRPRVRNIPNTTAQLIYGSFFAPLTNRFQAALRSPASRMRGVIFQSYLLSLYIKTLAILVHAAGPSTLALPQMTAELWGLLLHTSIRAHCVGDLSVTHAVLFAFLAILDVNEDRMRDVCRDMPREVVETQEWVSAVFEGTRGGDGGEENDVKMLAAAVLIRLQEGVEKYRLMLVGDMI
ncbi:hypothetical protein VTK73DRAFT_8723 [Phialemonium thermophilum]|uniref:Telomere length regulation protein conserved domain-containing protein n=1 Tax=Phialemonium thermophilum TaxID=223376 RepID=A0ABR3XNN7_9PEZI